MTASLPCKNAKIGNNPRWSIITRTVNNHFRPILSLDLSEEKTVVSSADRKCDE